MWPASVIRTIAMFFAVAVLVAASIAGCTRQISGTAQAEPQPHVFPNLDEFVSANPENFYVPLRGGPSYQFTTSTGVSCEINFGGPWCSGNFSPDPYESTDNVCSHAGRSNREHPDREHTYSINRLDDKCQSEAGPKGRLLEVGQKLVADWGPQVGVFTCAVGENGLVACIDTRHNHGFVIEPTGAWTF
ncbi:hypothetical protein [Mycobacterium sp. NPDC004974]